MAHITDPMSGSAGTGARSSPPVNALTIDFEDWYHGLEIPMSGWSGFEDRMERAGRKTLQMFADAGARATFFVLGWVAEKYPHLVREIAAAGHEVGTHGYSHTLVYKLEPNVFRAELERSIRVLEDLVGKPVLGHRAPFFSITKQSLWALDIMAELGLRYDSSIYPVYNYRYGIEDAPRWPYSITQGGRTMLEFPISTWRLFGKNLPIAGGAYFRIYPYALTRAGFRAINGAGHPAVFYLHPWELDPDHPRIDLPRRIAATHYVNLNATERRLRRLLADFKFAPMKEVLNVG
jgi:polysaccharide deacetylase family protein (PEP-CTERM system associated)